jgi:hypothetical protein
MQLDIRILLIVIVIVIILVWVLFGSTVESKVESKKPHISIGSWNLQRDVGGVNTSVPDQAIFTAEDHAYAIPEDLDVMVLQEVYLDEDAKRIISHLKCVYPYYLRSSPAPFRNVSCKPETQEKLQNVFQCIQQNNIESISINTLQPCINEINSVIDEDPDCVSCTFVQAFMEEIRQTRSRINDPQSNEQSIPLDQFIFERCFTNTDNNNATNYNGQSGLLILSKKPLQYSNSCEQIALSDLGISENIKDGLINTTDDRLIRHYPSFTIQRSVISFSYDKINILAVHLPYDIGTTYTDEALQTEIINSELSWTNYDILIGDFNSEPQYQREAYNRIKEYGYINLPTEQLSKPLLFQPSNQFGYGDEHSRGMTYCHNDSYVGCKGISKTDSMLRIDHIFVGPNMSSDSTVEIFNDGIKRLSDHNAIKAKCYRK